MTVELFDPIDEKRDSLSIFPLRENEPEYAKLNDPEVQDTNRYGNKIDLLDLGSLNESLNINGVDEVGFNPNRNKQHAFHFTADNCIGCHACESACSEKNDLPPHLSFRSVGYVEGGSFPNYTRMNISMACNHCDDPVCLKGCPTRAYTKHPEYGAVIQDPDICFGCGYCTWVCPYNAPQLDPVNGQVEKCNMCVDRLEVGLKPACVSACLGNALNFGVVENTPENREQIDTRIPGFPDPEISKPNIRFQQTKSMPREVTRTDSAAVKYQRDDEAGHYKPVVDQKAGKEKHWNLGRLSSRENPLVIFTLSVQAAVGIFACLFLGGLLNIAPVTALAETGANLLALAASIGFTGLGLLMSTVHLGKPMRFYRGFNNLKHSPVSREGAGIVAFMAFAAVYFLLTVPANPWVQQQFGISAELVGTLASAGTAVGALALLSGIVALFYMYKCYCIKARPFWNHWQSATSFYGNMLNLGALITIAAAACFAPFTGGSVVELIKVLGPVMVLGMVIEGIGLSAHAKAMNKGDNEGAVSHYAQCTTFGKTYMARNIILAVNLLAVLVASQMMPEGITGALLALGLAGSVLVTTMVSRALFYVLVVPTTMPGAFFWKNKAFEEHAREIGLADLPQTGVVHLSH